MAETSSKLMPFPAVTCLKSHKINYWISFGGLILLLSLLACEPLVYTFDSVEDAQHYSAKAKSTVPLNPETIKVVTWNIRFGAGRLPWFGDACGNRVILSEGEVKTNLQRIADKINTLQADVVLLQEVDILSKRSAYIDQVQWLLNQTHLNYGVYASAWHAQFIPSDGLGRMDMGTAILSRWPLSEAQRIALPLRGDQEALTQYFYLRRNILRARLDLRGQDNLYLVNVHTAAFSVDDTKLKQINRFLEELNSINDEGAFFIAGGDLNTLPPGSDSTDFCMEDKCSDETFHQTGKNPFHKEGSDYTNEQTWLSELYQTYYPAVPLARYQQNQFSYFTHTTNHPQGKWNRKLDYLFTNDTLFIKNSDVTGRKDAEHSDHAPVSVEWRLPK